MSNSKWEGATGTLQDLWVREVLKYSWLIEKESDGEYLRNQRVIALGGKGKLSGEGRGKGGGRLSVLVHRLWTDCK